MIFEELNLSNALLKALADLEFVNPTPIQEKAFPVVMSGKDVIGIAQTGTGKTFAYLLPILRQYTFSNQKDPRILILVPTRELVIQVVEEIRKLTTYMSVRVVGVYGGTNINNQKELLYAGLDILVATPGRLVDLAMTGLLRLKSIQKLVIDEVDEMLNLGFRPQLISLMEIISPKRQNLMFSATLTEDVDRLITDFFSNTCKIEVAHGTPVEKISQIFYKVPNYYTKINLLELLLDENSSLSRVLVFVNKKKTADRLFETIDPKFPGQIGVLHSNKSQNFRINALKYFEEGSYRVLVTTDLVARGLDISDISHVINFEMAETAGDYVNRIGRTGRADKIGAAISFITEKEKVNQLAAEELMKMAIPEEILPANLKISHEFTEEENPTNLFDKNYYKSGSAIKESQGAYHEKKVKNKKINLGGPGTRNPKFGIKKKQPVAVVKPPKFKF